MRAGTDNQILNTPNVFVVQICVPRITDHEGAKVESETNATYPGHGRGRGWSTLPALLEKGSVPNTDRVPAHATLTFLVGDDGW